MRRVWLLGIAAALIACHPSTPPAPTKAACDRPGTVLPSELDNTSTGTSYRFTVYLPPCFEADPQQSYPVLYLIPERGSGPDAWFAAGAAEAADAAVLDGRVPAFIIVSTGNTDNDPYARTIQDDLMPYMQNHFPLFDDRAHRSVAGGSLGGVAAYRIVFQHPDQFASCGMFGSGLISGEETAFESWLAATSPANAPRVFLNTGEHDPFMLDRARVMETALSSAGIQPTFVIDDGGHDYASWMHNFPAYLAWLAQDW